LKLEQSLSIIGSGGHAKVIIEAAELSGYKIDCLYDDDINKKNNVILGYSVNGLISEIENVNLIIAIGDNKSRKRIALKVNKAKWATIIHPTAIISKNVIIGEGTVIMAGVVIQPGVKIGKHCIVNTGSCIDHDCIIEDFAHIAPKCGLAGAVSICEGAFIGIGSSIVPNKAIGKWSVVGAGSVIIKDIPGYSTSYGIPAKTIKFHYE
jgi:sugar O-acyltransferase (sialic acid O-acetyltransferase NeuD family)